MVKFLNWTHDTKVFHKCVANGRKLAGDFLRGNLPRTSGHVLRVAQNPKYYVNIKLKYTQDYN